MATTLANLETYVARDLRDTSNATWSTAELDDLINQGIDALADVYPREIVQTIGTVAASVFTYSVSDFTRIYRVDRFNSASTYLGTIDRSLGAGRDSGWEVHGGILYTPPNLKLSVGDTLQAFGYGRYAQLSVSTATTNLDTSGIWAVRVFCQAEAFSRLLPDRAKFQQWQSNSNNTDVTLLGLAQLTQQARGRWEAERARLRRLRKSA